jgi:hypothetical protein
MAGYNLVTSAQILGFQPQSSARQPSWAVSHLDETAVYGEAGTVTEQESRQRDESSVPSDSPSGTEKKRRSGKKTSDAIDRVPGEMKWEEIQDTHGEAGECSDVVVEKGSIGTVPSVNFNCRQTSGETWGDRGSGEVPDRS